MKNKSVAIQDVAKASGVSVSTVSRVLNNKPDVSERTRQQVQQVIDELGYVPYVQSVQRISTRPLTVMVLYPLYDPHTPVADTHTTGFFGGIGHELHEHGYSMQAITTRITPDDLATLCETQTPDGIILMDVTQVDWRVQMLRQYGIPFVLIGQQVDNTGLCLVDVDHSIYVRMALDHLLNLGHRHIGFLTYSQSRYDAGFSPAVQAQLAYNDLCQKYDLPDLSRAASFDATECMEITLDLLASHPEVTAIAAVYGVAAAGAVRALHQLHRHIPADISVICALATQPEAEQFSPALTAINFPTYAMGVEAARMLLHRLKEPAYCPQVIIPPQLIERESVGPLRKHPDASLMTQPSSAHSPKGGAPIKMQD